jgi:hypothetical protein
MLEFIGFIVICLGAIACLLVGLQLVAAQMYGFDAGGPIGAVLLMVGAGLIWTACHLAPFTIHWSTP